MSSDNFGHIEIFDKDIINLTTVEALVKDVILYKLFNISKVTTTCRN